MGSLYGYHYYSKQLSQTPAYLWPFVPDCPFYTSLFSLVLIGLLFGVRSDLFNFIVCIGLIKYGLWTIFVLSLFGDFFFNPTNPIFLQSAVLWVLHLGQAAEGFTLPFKSTKPWFIPVALSWFLLNDYLDYFGPAVHPLLPPRDLTVVLIFTVIMTFFITALVWKLHKRNLRIELGLLG